MDPRGSTAATPSAVAETLNLSSCAATAVNILTSATSRLPTFCLPLSPPTEVSLQPYLANELPPLVHTDVEAGLCSFDPHAAPKCVRLHYEFG